MYKLLLCWRYLLTRYLALACIISVLLGVATLIVVNSVMSGFSTKLRERLHGLLSDVLIEARGLEGFDDPQGKMARIRQDPFLNSKVEVMTSQSQLEAEQWRSVWPSIEDYRFYQHGALDLKGTLRALVKNQAEGGVSQGGSSITQQMVKMNRADREERT